MPGLARFEGKVAIVTGAASGIGRAVLRRFVAEGGLVTGVDLNEAGLEESVALANAEAGAGGRASYLVGSVAEEADVKRIVETVTSRDGRLDVLANIAGVLRTIKTSETSLDLFLSIVRINLGGTFLFCREALPHLIEGQHRQHCLDLGLFRPSLYGGLCQQQGRGRLADPYFGLGIYARGRAGERSGAGRHRHAAVADGARGCA